MGGAAGAVEALSRHALPRGPLPLFQEPSAPWCWCASMLVLYVASNELRRTTWLGPKREAPSGGTGVEQEEEEKEEDEKEEKKTRSRALTQLSNNFC